MTLEPLDLLSNLPTCMITKILGHVPIREAVRTSVLSRQWRHLWCTIPNLKFDDSYVKRLRGHDEAFARFVYRVLLLHQGPVHMFEISGLYYRPEFSDINQWVTFVSRNGVQNLSLEFASHVRAPSSLFQCSNLTASTLKAFISLELPVCFEGFKSLKTLTLFSVNIDICSLERLISGCPLLESLWLYYSHSEVLKIRAPLLKYLVLRGNFEEFILDQTHLLEEIEVRKNSDVAREVCYLSKFIDQVPLLQKLVYVCHITKDSLVRQYPTTFAITLSHLWFIHLRIDFTAPAEIHRFIWLMCSSPVLEELKIMVKRPAISSEGTDGSVS